MNIDNTIDITDVVCPVTYVKVKVELEDMEPGQVLSVRLNSGDAMQNVPRSLKNDGHRVFDVTDNEDGTYTILVERGQDDEKNGFSYEINDFKGESVFCQTKNIKH